MVPYRYYAFISYSHADRAWADWLHKALETYRVPSRLVGRSTPAGPIPKSLAPVFRDREELPSANDLNRKVGEALEQSASLVVICSPHSAASRWVNQEILEFKRMGRADRVFCLIVDGEPDASEVSGRAAEECFAPALRFQLGADGQPGGVRAEPIAADARAVGDGKANAKLKLISGLLGIGFNDLRQRELQRRNRRMAAVTVAALAVMTLTTALAISAVIARDAAEVARQAAERRQKQAEHLVGFMLGDLNDKLAQVQRLDIMEAVDDQAMQYFQSLPTTDVTDEALAQRAKALEKIGSVRMDQGHLGAAMQAYQASLKFAAALAGAAPRNVARQVAYARIWAFIGRTHWYQGELDDALHGFQAAQAILLRARTVAPADHDVIFELATLDNNIGHVLESRARFGEATVQYQAMLDLTRTLLAADPRNPEWLVQSGLAHNNLGKMALLRGDLATAIAEYAADERIESALAARDAKDNNQRENLLLVRGILGRTLALTGNQHEAIGYLRDASAIAAQLQAADPDNAGIREDVALCALQLARLLRLGGDTVGAEAQATKAASILAALNRQDPANTGWRREYAEARLEQAEQSRIAGQAGVAQDSVRSALALLDPLLADEPDDRPTLLSTISARLLLADLVGQSDATAAQALRTGTLDAVGRQQTGDPRLDALRVSALLALHRTSEAQPVIQHLWRSGYREPAFTALLHRQGLPYPTNTEFAQRLRGKGGLTLLAASTAIPKEPP
ncbi:MAG: TIR domain-containing protein [Luteimonas sp.]